MQIQHPVHTYIRAFPSSPFIHCSESPNLTLIPLVTKLNNLGRMSNCHAAGAKLRVEPLRSKAKLAPEMQHQDFSLVLYQAAC